jgi:hypothetical protein
LADKRKRVDILTWTGLPVALENCGGKVLVDEDEVNNATYRSLLQGIEIGLEPEKEDSKMEDKEMMICLGVDGCRRADINKCPHSKPHKKGIGCAYPCEFNNEAKCVPAKTGFTKSQQYWLREDGPGIRYNCKNPDCEHYDVDQGICGDLSKADVNESWLVESLTSHSCYSKKEDSEKCPTCSNYKQPQAGFSGCKAGNFTGGGSIKDCMDYTEKEDLEAKKSNDVKINVSTDGLSESIFEPAKLVEMILKGQIVTLLKKVEDLQGENKELSQKCEKLELENSDAQKMNEALSFECKTITERCENQRKELKRMNEERPILMAERCEYKAKRECKTATGQMLIKPALTAEGWEEK